MSRVVYVEVAHLSLGDREDVSNSSYYQRELVLTLPIVFIFFSGHEAEVVIPSYAFGFIYIQIKLDFVSFITLQFYGVCK